VVATLRAPVGGRRANRGDRESLVPERPHDGGRGTRGAKALERSEVRAPAPWGHAAPHGDGGVRARHGLLHQPRDARGRCQDPGGAAV